MYKDYNELHPAILKTAPTAGNQATPAACRCGKAPTQARCTFLPFGPAGAAVLGAAKGYCVCCASCSVISWAEGLPRAVGKWNAGKLRQYNPALYILAADNESERLNNS